MFRVAADLIRIEDRAAAAAAAAAATAAAAAAEPPPPQPPPSPADSHQCVETTRTEGRSSGAAPPVLAWSSRSAEAAAGAAELSHASFWDGPECGEVRFIPSLSNGLSSAGLGLRRCFGDTVRRARPNPHHDSSVFRDPARDNISTRGGHCISR